MKVNRFGNMNPPEEYKKKPYVIDHPPFAITDNLYYVGNEWASSLLIDTGDGLMLLDTPTASGLPALLYNISLLGFNPKDLRHIVVSHAHSDHFGAVSALVYMTHAKTYMGRVDAMDMKNNPDRMEAMNEDLGAYNNVFEPDVLLDDGDIIQAGNTTMRCVFTPGHTVGVMSHFWNTWVDGQPVKAGIYGGAGFGSLSTDRLLKNGQSLTLQKTFADSIDKVWGEQVDVMLGNAAVIYGLTRRKARNIKEFAA